MKEIPTHAEDRPRTIAWPVLARVVIETRHKHLLNATESRKELVQVLDFYPKTEKNA